MGISLSVYTWPRDHLDCLFPLISVDTIVVNSDMRLSERAMKYRHYMLQDCFRA